MKILVTAVLCSLLLFACRPKPIGIDVAQSGERIAIASTALDAHTVIISASYSVTSLFNLEEAGKGGDSGIAAILVDSALVTIEDGFSIDTLEKVSPGLYRTTSVNLQSGNVYTLKVLDYKSGRYVQASTQYQPPLFIDSMKPFVDRRPRDTAVQLTLDLHDDRPGTDYYLMAYDKINPITIPSAIGSSNFAILNSDVQKRVEVFSDAEAIAGRITKTFNLEIGPRDTLFVQYGRITKGYYDFLASYKRSGSILTQATAEPVTLPSNIMNGLGYFSLYDPGWRGFVLRDF